MFTPPQFFKQVSFHRHTDRSITWLELFYDLVYVGVLIQIGNFLSDNLTWVGFGQFLLLIAAIWWAWTGETFYQNRYVSDDLVHRLLVFLQTFAIACMGVSISGAFGELYGQFTLAYVVTRLMLVLMYWRAARHHPESKALSHGYMVGFGLGALIWSASLFLPFEIHWVGWGIGLLVELATPVFGYVRRQRVKVGLDHHHLAERMGIFTIIVLGEAYVKVLDEGQGQVLTLPVMLFSTFGLLVTWSLWWLYFSDTTDAMIDYTSPSKPLLWIYGHLPLSAGLVMFGVAAKKVFVASAEYPTDALDPKYRLLYTGALVFFLAAVALIDYCTVQRGDSLRRVWLRATCAVAVGLIGFWATEANPIVFVLLVLVVMGGQVVYSIVSSRHTSPPATAHHPPD